MAKFSFTPPTPRRFALFPTVVDYPLRVRVEYADPHAQGSRMSTSRRTILAGLASLGATTALPAWAQFDGAIRPQSDPWAQVDPYADARNGFPSAPQGQPFSEASRAASKKPVPTQNTVPEPPSAEEIASQHLSEALTDPEAFEILSARRSLHYSTVIKPDERQGGIVRNSALQQAFRRFCQPFLDVADRGHLPWEVYVTDFPRPNGLAYGGGKITIASGTILYADHPGELAGIVVHEIGHNDHRHISDSKEIEALMTLQRSGGAGASISMTEALQKLDPHFQNVLSNGFSRAHEREADAHVPELFERVGMDTEHYVVMFKKMMSIYGQTWDQKTCLMDTHPAMAERIELLRGLSVGRRPRHEATLSGWAELKRHFPTPSGYRWG
ncbi:MAG: M48 family metalloprotease [Rhodospirillaceae bacterium]|nr:M48 family metalloprotease [Rhodospirillales bacterium]